MIFVVVLLSIIVFLLVLYLMNVLYKRSNAYRNQFLDIDKLKEVSLFPDNSLELIVLGSNAPKFAFDFSEIKDFVCMNLAIGPETFEYDFIILRKYAQKLKSGAAVILPVCPGNFFLYKFLNKSDLTKYYEILSAEEFPEYNWKQCVKDYRFPLLFHPKRVKYLIKDARRDQRMLVGHNLLDADGVKKDAEWWIHKCWNPEFDIDIENMKPLSERNQQSVEANIRIVREMAYFCKEHGFQFILVYLPLTKELGDKFPESYVKNQMTAYVLKAMEGFDIPLVDYMRDPRFQKHEYYINSFFMNRVGAKAFTRIFIDENIKQ